MYVLKYEFFILQREGKVKTQINVLYNFRIWIHYIQHITQLSESHIRSLETLKSYILHHWIQNEGAKRYTFMLHDRALFKLGSTFIKENPLSV